MNANPIINGVEITPEITEVLYEWFDNGGMEMLPLHIDACINIQDFI